MAKTIRIGRKEITVRENLVDRVVQYFNPIKGRERLRARVNTALIGGYIGGSKSRRSLKSFLPNGNSANTDLLPNLDTLRSRSRDLTRNTPVAAAAVNTVVTSVVGTGLRAKAAIKRKVLSLSDDEADAWENRADLLWDMWANTAECDATRTQTFNEIQDTAFRGALESGDILSLLPSIERPDSPFRLRLQMIEADRLENENFQRDTATLAGGVEMDEFGAPTWYHILDRHPGDYFGKAKKWSKVRAFGARSGRRQVLHLYDKLRPGQTRGVPYLAPVIESLKQLGEYTDAELMAAVVSGMFTVFIKTEDGGSALDVTNTTDETGAAASDDDIKLGNGAVVGLAQGESIESANPGRPNSAFDPFVIAILRQVGAALEIPFELLLKHFSASYSASRASLLEAWRFFRRRRGWLVNSFCNPVRAEFIAEMVATGKLNAPGFFDDAIVRHAYLGCIWRGLPQGHIQPQQEAQAMKIRRELGVTTIDQETADYNGGDWEVNHTQSAKEYKARAEAGIPESNGAVDAASLQPPQDTQVSNQ